MARQRKIVEVSCRDCNTKWQKRDDTLEQWHGRCRACAQFLAKGAPSDDEKRQKARACNQKYYYENIETVRCRMRERQRENKEYTRYLSARHRRYIRRAQLSCVDENRLKEIYANCPSGHHVDHIVPLRGETVSGLHVPWNLQYLPARENMRKSNSFNADGNAT